MKIAIIGAGYTGTMTACALSQNHDVSLIDTNRFGIGLAYSTPYDYHLLNVPAAKMSAFADKPNDFVEWLSQHGYSNPSYEQEPLGDQFISRRIYGLYIQSNLEQAQSKGNIELIEDEALEISRADKMWEITFKHHAANRYDKVILCTGNPKPDSQLFGKGSGQFIANPWAWEKITQIDTQAHVCILGTGLTMVDVMLSLHQNHHQGSVTAISRHGFLPKAHDLSAKPAALSFEHKSPKLWLRHIKHQANQADNWRSIIDGLRPFTQTIWQSFNLKQQQQFLRHIRSTWDVHRHRIAKPIADIIHQYQHSQQLKVIAGRIKTIDTHQSKLSLHYQPRHHASINQLHPDFIINCMGPSSDYRKVDSPLIANLLNQNIISTSANRLGLHTTSEGQAYDANGDVQPNLWILGPPTKGTFWEMIAVPDLRYQIHALLSQN